MPLYNVKKYRKLVEHLNIFNIKYVQCTFDYIYVYNVQYLIERFYEFKGKKLRE